MELFGTFGELCRGYLGGFLEGFKDIVDGKQSAENL